MRRAARILATTAIMALVMSVDSCINPIASTASKPPAAPSEQTPHSYDTPRSTDLFQTITHRPAMATTPTKVTVVRGDTYGRWAATYCGNFNAWTSIQQANGWPERRIPIGKTATIVCTGAPVYLATTATPAATPAWVHPLASGKTAESSGLCWGAPRVGHTHKGVDLTVPSGTPIRAVTAGTVKLKASSGTAGNYVVIAHAGNIFTRYMHMRAPSPLPLGATVQAGQTIGYVGATGNAKGPHLHFEVLQGKANVNPAVFMRRHGVNIGCQ